MPEGRQPADVPLHGAGVHLRPHPRRAGRAGDAPDIGGAGAGHRAREPGLPAARGAELRAAAGAQPCEGGALDAHRRDSHPVPLRHLGAERLRGRLLRAEQGQPQPGDAQPQGPGQPKRHHKRHAGQRQVLRRQARDDQHGAALPRGRRRHHRPRRRVRPAGRGLRRPQRGVRPGLRDVSEPARPKRRLRAFGDDPACLQDRGGAGSVRRVHGGGQRGPLGRRALDHQPLRGEGVPDLRQERSRPAVAGPLRHPAAAAGARGRDRRAAVRAIRLRGALHLQPPEQRRLRQAHHLRGAQGPARQHARFRHHRGAGGGAQPHVRELRARRDDLALHRRGPEPLRAPCHHQLLQPVLGGGAQVQPDLHRHHPELHLPAEPQ